MRVRDLFEDGDGTIAPVAPGKSRPDSYQTKPKATPKRPRYQPEGTPAPKPAASKSVAPVKPAAPAAPATPA